jgi:PAS domain S-box-containing protein
MDTVQKTILIIEDDLGLNELISEKIIESGFQTYSATSTNEAINWLSKNTPTLMVVDYSLNDMTAKDFVLELKSRGLSIPPFIISTGQGNERVAVEMMKLGARDYIIKDTNLLELLPTVISRVVKEIHNENKLKIAETELKESNEKYRLLIDNSGIGVGVFSLEGKVLLFNQKALQNLGGKFEDYIGKSLIELFGDELGSEYLKRIQDAAKSEISLEFEDNFQSAGGSFWFLSNHSRIKNSNNEIVGVQVLSHDITERKLAQLEIERIGKHYQSIIENAPDGFVLINSEGNFKYVSPAGRRIFGYDLDEVINAHPNDSTHPDDLPMVLSYLVKLINDPSYIAKLEYRFAHKNGHWIWIESTFTNLLSDPNVESIVINFRDITERKLVETSLFESEKRFSLFMDHLPASVFLKDNNGKTLYVNKYMDDSLGASQWVGKDMLEIFPNEFGEKLLADDKNAMKMGYLKREENIQHLDKIIHTYETQKFIIPQLENESLLGGIAMDITERKKIEEAVQFLITCGVTSSGEDFFESLAKYLSQILDMEYVCIDKLDSDGLTAHTLANYNDGTFDSNISYTLHQTPCGEVVGKTICCFPENVCNLFPYDYMLRDMNAESYVGTTLWSFDGKAIGLIAIIGRKPLNNRVLAENILRLVSVRAAGELERKQVEDALRESERVLLKSQQIAQLGSYTWDITKGYWTSSAILDDIFGIDDNYNRTTQGWLDLIHPDWQDIMSDYITKDIILKQQRFDKEYKIIRKENGQECWLHGLGDLEFDSQNQPVMLIGTISNINQRKLAELEILENENQLKMLLLESSKLIDTGTESIDYQKISDTILRISGSKYVSFNIFDENGMDFSTVALSGIKEHVLKVPKFFGFDVINKSWKFDPIRTEKIKDNVITHFDSLFDIAKYHIPKAALKLVESTFNVGDIFVVRVTKNNISVGDFTLIYEKGTTIQNRNLVSLYSNQVGLYIERKKADEALIKKMNEMEYFQSITVGRELKMIELKKEINQLLNALGKENKYIIVD